MLFATAFVALASLLPGLASAGPIQKRLTNQIIRSYRTNTCLSVQPGTQIINGSPLIVTDCNIASRWDISPGSGSVLISGTNFALDAGVPQGNNNPGKVWQSYPGSPQQTWFLTADNRIAVTGGNQCLDEGDNGPQTYQCTTGNTNQIWYVQTPGTPSSSSVAPPPSSSSVAPPPSSSSAPPPTATGKQLRFQGTRNLCATVQGGAGGNGVLVNAQTCASASGAAAAGQLFNFMGNGLIMYSGTNYCLDAGSNPADGTQMKLWQCYVGLSQQTWAFPNGYGLFRTANNQCLDVDNGNFFKIQTWTCSQPDPQQQFSIV